MKKTRSHDDLHRTFYDQTIARVNDVCNTSDDLCFVYVQHAFSPLITHISCLQNRLAALIPKASSSSSNSRIVNQLENAFPRRVYADINRGHLRNTDFTLNLLKHVTKRRPFAILEYGGYFAPCAEAIANDPTLGPKLVGFVEGTENGIKGADDGSTIGYQQVANRISKPIISKSKSRIKKIMDRDIGPAIIESCNNILLSAIGSGIRAKELSIGIIGLGSIGKGLLRHLNDGNIQPFVYDIDLAVMAELAHCQHSAVPLEILLAKCDLIFMNTGSCFLAQQPELLNQIKENAIIVLCTSGDIEAGIPQLIATKQLELVSQYGYDKIAIYKTRKNKPIRIMLASDGIGQAPNLAVESGSGSLANLMSDMEFYALGCYLASNTTELPVGCISDSPVDVQNLVIEQWLEVFHPECINIHRNIANIGGAEQSSLTRVPS